MKSTSSQKKFSLVFTPLWGEFCECFYKHCSFENCNLVQTFENSAHYTYTGDYSPSFKAVVQLIVIVHINGSTFNNGRQQQQCLQHMCNYKFSYLSLKHEI